VSDVQVESTLGYALVQFTDIVAAFMAQQSLNNFYLNKYNASLSVKWVIKKETHAPSSAEGGKEPLRE
jgi:hypothetical protein